MKTIRVTGAVKVSDATSDTDVADATADAMRSSELFTVDGWEVLAVTPTPQQLPEQLPAGAVVSCEYLDALGCSNMFCDHTTHDSPLTVTGRCHPGKPVTATYYAGKIRVSCATCGRFVVAVEVAP